MSPRAEDMNFVAIPINPIDIYREPPYPPKPTPRRRPKAVTIAASFQFKGGIVLCADRMITHGEATVGQAAFASYEKKIWARRERGFSVIITGTGTGTTIKHLKDRIIDRLVVEQGPAEELYQFPSDVNPKQIVMEELADAFQVIPPTDGADLLIAVNDYHRGLTALHTSDSIMNTAKPAEALGLGENSLIGFLLDNSYSELLAYAKAVSLGALVVYTAKSYCPQYCGGLTDIYALRTEDRTVFEVPRNRIDDLELFFKTAIPLQLDSLLSEAATLVQPTP